MAKITPPNVKVLATGENLIVKQMQAKSGAQLPPHSANLESVVILLEGECIFILDEEKRTLVQGDTIVVPPHIRHQFIVTQDFRAAHIMPKEIKFEFYEI
ncbi:MAG: cupin domain-containing protein [Flavobacteriaceae bacterium]|nr:cupin domain-containing protein [Flavobacteriaceae bacterium]